MNIPKNTVVFSFDDGPNERVTPQLLDVLKKYDVKAVFVLLGVNAEKNPHIVRRIKNEGHYIANHGYYGNWAITMNDDKFTENLQKGETAIVNALGAKPQSLLYRPHGGFFSRKQAVICNEMGYEILGANIRTYDAAKSYNSKNTIVKEIVKKAIMQKGGVILLHDARDEYFKMERGDLRNKKTAFNRDWIPGVVEEIILQLRPLGFSFKQE